MSYYTPYDLSQIKEYFKPFRTEEENFFDEIRGHYSRSVDLSENKVEVINFYNRFNELIATYNKKFGNFTICYNLLKRVFGNPFGNYEEKLWEWIPKYFKIDISNVYYF